MGRVILLYGIGSLLIVAVVTFLLFKDAKTRHAPYTAAELQRQDLRLLHTLVTNIAADDDDRVPDFSTKSPNPRFLKAIENYGFKGLLTEIRERGWSYRTAKDAVGKVWSDLPEDQLMIEVVDGPPDCLGITAFRTCIKRRPVPSAEQIPSSTRGE